MAQTPLHTHLPDTELRDPDAILGRFLDWLAGRGLAPYPAQEEAFLELMGGRHVILATPTGSGKSMAAALLHFKALCERERSFYTCPTKALASEKFFWLCDELGARYVGMLTGDASINADAPVVCCTTEVLANMALRRGAATPAPYVVMDEFHYYGDPSRGMAWQIPLLALPRTQFLLMSATLGDTAKLAERLHARSGRAVARVHSETRPVPLDFEYRETPLHETVEALLEQGRAPVYVVHFTQRQCAEQAQALTSAKICTREERARIREAVGDFRFDTAYGREFRRFIGFGIGIHHAGLLPRYRLLVEQLAQRGMLKVVCGTDTLGVGVNIPIRTVLFARLAKFDGERVALLSVREFRQIAGRAGRKGFDERGSVVCQAPERAVEARKARRRAETGARRRPAGGRSSRDTVQWNRDTFQRLIHGPMEPLQSRFRIAHGLMVLVLQRDPDGDAASGYRAVAELIELSHESPARRRRLRRDAARVFRSLRRAGIVTVWRDPATRRFRVGVSDDLQSDFSLHHSLSLYLVDAIAALDPDDPDYALDAVSVAEAILDDPVPILRAQEDRAKREVLARLKAEGVPYEERVRLLDEITYPRPLADFIYATFDLFAEKHPWLRHENIRPKAIAREMFEIYASFEDYVRSYGLARLEGRLLRYLGDAYKTLVQNVPEAARSAELEDVIAFLRTVVYSVDSSLFEEWESLVHPRLPASRPGGAAGLPAGASRRPDLARDPRALAARARAELHHLVQALATRRYAEAAAAVAPDSDGPWDAGRLERALAPFYAEHDAIVFNHRARLAEHTALRSLGPGRWRATQVLLDSDDENDFCIEAEIDLRADPDPAGPLLRLRRIGV